jgi:hypothetical protein
MNDIGTYVALDSATIRAGQFVTYDANGFIIPSTGTGTIGVSKWNKQQFGVSVNVDEAVTLVGVVASNLARPNVSNVAVRSAINFGGTLYTPGVGNDYVVNAANGTVTRDPLTTIPDGATVYVTYTYALTDADFEFDGRDFRNQSNNDVLGQENRITVITNWARLFTIEYDTSVNYGTAANFKLYVSAAGKATSAAGTDFAGQVHQPPRADDPYLGMAITGNPVP